MPQNHWTLVFPPPPPIQRLCSREVRGWGGHCCQALNLKGREGGAVVTAARKWTCSLPTLSPMHWHLSHITCGITTVKNNNDTNSLYELSLSIHEMKVLHSTAKSRWVLKSWWVSGSSYVHDICSYSIFPPFFQCGSLMEEVVLENQSSSWTKKWELFIICYELWIMSTPALTHRKEYMQIHTRVQAYTQKDTHI